MTGTRRGDDRVAGGDQHGYLYQSRKQFLSCEEGGCDWWNEPREFSRWEAWQDMIQAAAYRPHRRTFSGGVVVDLDRGETPPRSVRYLSRRWGWSKKRVETFIAVGQERGRFRGHQRTSKGDTYLIVNYEVYQPGGDSEGTANGTARGQRGDSEGTKKKKGKKGKKYKSPNGDLFGAPEGTEEEAASGLTRARDYLWEALMEACGIEDPIPESARGAYNRACRELRDAGAEPEEVRRRADVYRRQWPKISLTPTALARRWPECADVPGHVQRADEADEWGAFHQLKQEKLG